jgi:hypothetical protein
LGDEVRVRNETAAGWRLLVNLSAAAAAAGRLPVIPWDISNYPVSARSSV